MAKTSRFTALAVIVALGAFAIGPRAAYARGYSESELRSVEKPDETQVRQIRDEEENQIRIALGRLATKHRRADLFLRLAEIYMEAYHAEFLLEGRVHDKRLAEGVHDTYIDRAHSRVYLIEGIKACKSVLSDGLEYQKLDEVYYFLAFNYGELGDQSTSLRFFRKLVSAYPNSPMVSEAYAELGDADYGKRDFRAAQHYYALAVRTAPVDTRPLILHKLAWSFFRTRDFDQAVATMKQAVALASQNGEKFLGLREEALRDMAVFMTEGGRVDEAMDYFRQVAGDKSFYPKLLEKLGKDYEHNAQPAKAIVVYRALLKTNPDDETRFRVMEKLVELDLKSARDNEALSQIHQIFATGGEPSGGDTETQVAGQNLRALVRHTATSNHELYRKNNDGAALRVAESFYQAYLASFLKKSDPHNETPEIQMYLAEVERDLGKSREASELYREVVKSGDSRYAKQAGALWTASLSEAIHNESVHPPHGGVKAAMPSALEKEYIDAADQLEESLGNTTEGREAALKAAQVEAGYSSTREDAIERARKLIKMAPASAQALIAARLWLQIESDEAARKHDDPGAVGDLKDAISDLSGNSDLIGADQKSGGKLNAMLVDQETRLKVNAIATSEKDKDYSAAAKGYESFARDSQSRDLAEKAYASAMLDFVKASDPESANRVSVEWLARYPGRSKAIDSLRAAATQLLISGDFATAAKIFMKLGDTGQDAASLETAALIENGVGDAGTAQQDWAEYLSRYSARYPEGRRASARADVILELAKSYEAQHDDSNAAKYYKLCMQLPELKAECGARLAGLYVKGEDWDSAESVFQSVAAISAHRHATLSPYVGYARFQLAQRMEKSASFPPLALPASSLKAAIAKRTAFLKPLSRAYMNAVEAGGPWAVAALDQLAGWATQFADDVDAIAPPAGSSPEAAAKLKTTLKTLSDPLRRKAVSTWTQAYTQAASAEALSPVLPEIVDHLADAGASYPRRAQGVRGKFHLAGLAADGGADGREAALAKVRVRLQKSATDASAWIDYGNLLWGSGKPLLAKIMYDYALTLSPDNPSALNNRGVLEASQNEEDWAQAAQAEQLFRQALDQDEFFLPAKVNLALLMNYYRLFDKAKSYWMQVRTRVKNNPDVEDGYAIALQGTGDLDQAQTEFDRATQLGASSDRFALVYHQAARQSFDRSHLSLAGQKCLGTLEGLHEDALEGFEKSASDSLKKACTGWAGQ